MVHIKTIAPTIIDAVKAVELGCRKVQDDPFFRCEMSNWMSIDGQYCDGCLATSTLMHLSKLSSKDIIDELPSIDHFPSVSTLRRSTAYGIEIDEHNIEFCDYALFEKSINSFRLSDIGPLLKFYQLDSHQNARKAAQWLLDNHRHNLTVNTTKEELLPYADFLKDEFIPLLIEWFRSNS
jgi:hypothetical protein